MYVLPGKGDGAAAGEAGGLVTGSTDGKLQLWSAKLEQTAAFDLASLGGVSKVVQSVCWEPGARRLLVGSWSSEVYEVHDSEGYDLHDGPLVQGHYEHRVFGLCASPTEAGEVATVGEDRTVRVWDVAAHRVKLMATLDTMGHCIAWSPDGRRLRPPLPPPPPPLAPSKSAHAHTLSFFCSPRLFFMVSSKFCVFCNRSCEHSFLPLVNGCACDAMRACMHHFYERVCCAASQENTWPSGWASPPTATGRRRSGSARTAR